MAKPTGNAAGDKITCNGMGAEGRFTEIAGKKPYLKLFFVLLGAGGWWTPKS